MAFHSLSQVRYNSLVQVNFYLISIIRGKTLRAFQDWKPDVDGVSIEDTSEGFCYDALDSRPLNSPGSVFSGGTAAEIITCDEDSAGLYARGEIFSIAFQTVLAQFLGVS